MPTYHITAPDGSEYEVTGNGSEQDALAHIQSQWKPPTQAAPQAAAAPPAEPSQPHAVSPQGAVGEAALNFGTSMLAAPVAGFAGLAQGAKNLISSDPTNMPAADRVRQVQSALTYEPRTAEGQGVSKVAAYPGEKIGQFANYAGGKTTDFTGSPALGTAVNTGIQALPMALLKGRGKAGEVAGDVSRTPAVGPRVDRVPDVPEGAQAPPAQRPAGLAAVSEDAPTKKALKDASQAAYKRADESGAVISADSFSKVKQVIKTRLEKDGVDPSLHPDATAALKRITETDGPVTLQKFETLRKIAKDAEGSIKPADARLASKIVDTIDNFSETLSQKDMVAGTPEAAAALKEARGLWSRVKKADTLDQLMKRAELSAPNFSGSGMENAIRTEFRALAKNETRMRQFNPEERTAIERVAKGGKVENALRFLGKAAPTGIVSAGLGSGLGLAAGGPVGAIAVPAVGAAARFTATRMTMRNAANANALVRRGPVPKPKSRNALLEPERVR